MYGQPDLLPSNVQEPCFLADEQSGGSLRHSRTYWLAIAQAVPR